MLITSSLTKVVSSSFLDARDFYEILRDFCESSDLFDVLGFRSLFKRMVISYCFLAAEIAPNVGERRCFMVMLSILPVELSVVCSNLGG